MPRFHRFPIFFAPDVETAGTPPPTQVADVGTPEISVPVIPSAPRGVSDVVLPGNEALESAPVLKDLQKEVRKVRGPQDFGMESAEESSERMGLTKRERGPDGKFLPKGVSQQSSPSSQQPKAKATQPPAAAKPTPTAQPTKPAPVAQPAAPAKVKIGGEEKTVAEWEAEMSALKAGKTQSLPPAAKAPEVPAKTAEETAAEQKERETKFIDSIRSGYLMDPAPGGEYDQMIAGGEKGAQAFATALAKAEMRGRQFNAEQVNQLAEHYDRLLAPILNQNQTVHGLMQEAAFLGAHPDIKSNPKGLETFREMKTTMESGRKAIADKITAGTATRREQLWAEEYDEATPESLMNDLATHTRAKLATLTPSPAAAPVSAKPAPQQVKPNPASVPEKPLGGDRPGGGAATPNGETPEQRIRREVNASKGINV